MSLKNRLDRLEKAEPDAPVRPDWDALLRGDWAAFCASTGGEPPVEEVGDPIEEEIARVRRDGGSEEAFQADEPVVRGKSGAS